MFYVFIVLCVLLQSTLEEGTIDCDKTSQVLHVIIRFIYLLSLNFII